MFKSEEKPGNFCPLLRKQCVESKCAWWTKLIGKDPQSEATINKWGCAIAWTPILLVELSQHERQTGAAVESMRNEVTKRMDEPLSIGPSLEILQRSLEKQ